MANYETIKGEIDMLVAAGNLIENIFVNDGADEWGVDCACTLAQCNELLDDWESDDALHGSRDEAMSLLVPAAQWLEDHMPHEDRLREMAGNHIGERYDSESVIAMINENDWSDYWPVVDAAGELTGDIVGSENEYYNVADLAMVHESELTPAQLRTAKQTGYAEI